ncbi:MAG: hypothetical protein LBB87_05185, partial [Nitrososphaerota archaeon]|nr:hypothetical protein [Nitrososphaerota archaeon]
QYVPIGYSTTPLSSEHVPLASEHSTSKPFLAKPVMAVIVLTAGIVVACLLVYFKKRRHTREI